MNVVIAIDSFKGSITSLEAGEQAKKGICKVFKDAKVYVRPIADGGEGTVEALTFGMGGRLENVCVLNPLAKKIICTYGIVSCGKGKINKTAIIEISSAAGLTLIEEKEKNPLNTTTYGVGEIIRDAIIKGCRHFIIGIGGSATNDGGIGMLQALGYEFLDEEGKQVPFGAKGLTMIKKIADTNVIPELKECTFRIACDVNNELCGSNGASFVYGAQKGATKEMIKQMDKWLGIYAKLSKEKYKKADATKAGTGAAGGLGFAFLTYTNAVLDSGVKIVLEETNLEEYIKNADIVITGEGRLDEQTIMGKAPVGVAKLAKKYNKKVIALAGSVTNDAKVCNEYGIDAYFPVLRNAVSLKEAMNSKNVKRNITETTEQIFRLIKCVSDL